MPEDKPIFKQINPFTIVDPNGRSIPINLANMDYFDFDKKFQAGEVTLELAFDPMEPRP